VAVRIVSRFLPADRVVLLSGEACDCVVVASPHRNRCNENLERSMDYSAIHQMHNLVQQGHYGSIREAAIDFVQYAQKRSTTGANLDAAYSSLLGCHSKDIDTVGGRLHEWFRDLMGATEIQREFEAFVRFRAFPQSAFGPAVNSGANH
jgi:hypothetical protein